LITLSLSDLNALLVMMVLLDFVTHTWVTLEESAPFLANPLPLLPPPAAYFLPFFVGLAAFLLVFFEAWVPTLGLRPLSHGAG